VQTNKIDFIKEEKQGGQKTGARVIC